MPTYLIFHLFYNKREKVLDISAVKQINVNLNSNFPHLFENASAAREWKLKVHVIIGKTTTKLNFLTLKMSSIA